MVCGIKRKRKQETLVFDFPVRKEDVVLKVRKSMVLIFTRVHGDFSIEFMASTRFDDRFQMLVLTEEHYRGLKHPLRLPKEDNAVRVMAINKDTCTLRSSKRRACTIEGTAAEAMKYYVILRNRNLLDRAYIDVTFAAKSRRSVPYAQLPLLDRLRTKPNSAEKDALEEELPEGEEMGAPEVSTSESEQTPIEPIHTEVTAASPRETEDVEGSEEMDGDVEEPESDEESLPSSETPSSEEEGSSYSSVYSESTSSSPSSSSRSSESESSPTTTGVTPSESDSRSSSMEQRRLVGTESSSSPPSIRLTSELPPSSSPQNDYGEEREHPSEEPSPPRRLSSPAAIPSAMEPRREADEMEATTPPLPKTRSSSVDAGNPPAILVSKISRGSTDEPREVAKPKKKVRFFDALKKKIGMAEKSETTEIRAEAATIPIASTQTDEEEVTMPAKEVVIKTTDQGDEVRGTTKDVAEPVVVAAEGEGMDNAWTERDEHLEGDKVTSSARTAEKEGGEELPAEKLGEQARRETTVQESSSLSTNWPKEAAAEERGKLEGQEKVEGGRLDEEVVRVELVPNTTGPRPLGRGEEELMGPSEKRARRLDDMGKEEDEEHFVDAQVVGEND